MSTPQTGIRFVTMYVEEIKYLLHTQRMNESPSEHINATFSIASQIKENRGYTKFSVTCKPPDGEHTGHELSISMVGVFERIGDHTSVPFERFLKYHAPTTLFPFLREFVHSITSRSPVPPILLDPVNIYQLAQEADSAESPFIEKKLPGSPS